MSEIVESKKNKETPKRWLMLFSLIVAGEAIFSLPFHVIRYFRPTFLDVFSLSNTQIGDAIAIYGVTAMVCYFPSGVIADRFSTRRLMSFSLFATALGGIWFAFIPDQIGLSLLFGYWGITNILLFWSAMLRATREWGGKLAQGKAFGLLDGGRGLVSALAASIAVFFLAGLLPDKLENESAEERKYAMQVVILFYSLLTAGAALLIWFFIPDTKIKTNISDPLKGIEAVLKSRSAWMQAIIVVCAYCGYRGLDFYALYGVEVLGMDEVSSARFMSNATYLRAVGAIGAGFIADRLTTKKVIVSTFILLLLSYFVLLFFSGNEPATFTVFASLIISILAVYALRGVYFALFEETNVPSSITGTTVGLVSLVGFTPDIFFNSIAGRIIDASPGVTGYHNFYFFLIVFAFVGLMVTLLLATNKNRKKTAGI